MAEEALGRVAEESNAILKNAWHLGNISMKHIVSPLLAQFS
jgi:hypothetical protein